MDILILAAIAIFVFIKLREQFGKIEEDQKHDSIKNFINEQAKLRNQNPVNQNPNQNSIALINRTSPSENELKDQKIIDQIDITIRQNFIDIISRLNSSACNFLSGANKAFTMVIEGFANEDLGNLKLLLAKELFSYFESSIKERRDKNQILKTRIVAIDESKIIDAKILGDFAFIKIRFTSRQINYICDNFGNLLNGNKNDIDSMNDIWTFKKDLNSDNPNWIISSTN